MREHEKPPHLCVWSCHLATEEGTERQVAIKELFPDGLVRDTDSHRVRPLGTDDDEWSAEDFAKLKAGFVREAKILIGLKHPQVVPVLTLFPANDTYYLVMEYIQGQTWLSYSAQNGPLPWEEAVLLLKKLAEPIHYLHEHEPPVYHRDLNPKNVLLQPQKDGSLLPIVIDFGLARAGVTLTHGTKAVVYEGYAPLEQYTDTPGEPRAFGPESDVYAISALLFRMLTAENPTPASRRALGAKLPAPHEWMDSVPEWLSEAVMEGLALVASNRLPTVRSLQERLEKPRTAQAAAPVETAAEIPPQPAPQIIIPQIIVPQRFGLTVEQARALPPTHPAPRTLEEYKAQMVQIPGGTFLMGSNDGRGNEKPVHSVSLSPFAMGRTPVTVAMWREFCTATGREMPNAPEYLVWQVSGGFLGLGKKHGWDSVLDHPMVKVSWNDCQAYASWAGLKLQTESQWEYAARGILEGKAYPWGDGMDDSKAWYGKTSDYKGTAPVSRSNNIFVNGYGLIDILGNVWQWCSDWYGSYGSSSATNPMGASSGEYKVLRGSSWLENAGSLRCAYRLNYHDPTSTDGSMGFRMVHPGP